MISIIKKQMDVDLTVVDLAEAFIQMDADHQAAFFEECNRIAIDSLGTLSAERQWLLVGEIMGNGGLSMLKDIVAFSRKVTP